MQKGGSCWTRFSPIVTSLLFCVTTPLLPLHISNQTINLYPSSFPNSCLSQSLFSVTAVSAPFCLHFPTSHILSGVCTGPFSHGWLFTKCKNSDISSVLWWRTPLPHSLFKWSALFHVINHVDDESRVSLKISLVGSMLWFDSFEVTVPYRWGVELDAGDAVWCSLIMIVPSPLNGLIRSLPSRLGSFSSLVICMCYCWHCTGSHVDLQLHFTLTCEWDLEIFELVHVGHQHDSNMTGPKSHFPAEYHGLRHFTSCCLQFISHLM